MGYWIVASSTKCIKMALEKETFSNQNSKGF